TARRVGSSVEAPPNHSIAETSSTAAQATASTVRRSRAMRVPAEASASATRSEGPGRCGGTGLVIGALPHDPTQLLEPVGEFAFGSVPGGAVVVAFGDRVGGVALGDDAERGVVRVDVGGAVLECGGALVVGVAQGGRDGADLAASDVGDGLVDGGDDGVGLGGGREVDDGL